MAILFILCLGTFLGTFLNTASEVTEGIASAKAAVDKEGRLYLVDSSTGHLYRKTGTAAPVRLPVEPPLLAPAAIAVSNRANAGLYIIDGHGVLKVSWNGSAEPLIADKLSSGRTNTKTSFQNARFNSPKGLAITAGGDLIIADTGNNAIYYANMVERTVELLAGTPGVAGIRDGSDALFNNPSAVAIGSDFIAVADNANAAVRLLTKDGVKTLPHRFEQITDVCIDVADNLLVATEQKLFVVRDVFGELEVTEILTGKVSAVEYYRGFIKACVESTVVSIAQPPPAISKIITANSSNVLRQDSDTFSIEGNNFTKGCKVSINGQPVKTTFVDTKLLKVSLGKPFSSPGRTIISVKTAGGLAQTTVNVLPVPIESLPAGTIATIAGSAFYCGDGSNALSEEVTLSNTGIAIDAAGNLYVADTAANRVRKVDVQTGEITTFAGNGRPETTGDGNLATKAGIHLPSDIAVDQSGNVYISQLAGSKIRRVDARTGIITTIAGTGETGFSGDGGPATKAAFFFGRGGGNLAIDADGNLFVCDALNQRVRRIDRATGNVTTVAGSGEAGFSGDGGPATKAAFLNPIGIAIDPSGNLFISDWFNNRIRKVDASSKIISTIAGTGEVGFSGDGGPASKATFNSVYDIAINATGNLYLCDAGNHRIRKVDLATGIISTVAGSTTSGFSGDGGPATQAALASPIWIDAALETSFLLADVQNSRVRHVDSAANIQTVAGSGKATEISSSDDIPAISTRLASPRGLAIDLDGSLLVVDTSNHRIRKITPEGTIKAAVGMGRGYSGDGGPAQTAAFEFPTAIALDKAGNYYIADSGNHRIRRVRRSTATIDTIAGNGTAGYSGEDVPATSASFNRPQGVAVDPDGNILIADTGNHRIRRIDAVTGRVTTIAGTGTAGTSGEGGPAIQAMLVSPTAVAVDEAGNIFVADNTRILKIDATTKNISTLLRGLAAPQSIVVDRFGTIFIADTGNCQVLAFDNQLRKVAGSSGAGFEGDLQSATSALLDRPAGLAVANNGNLYIADTGNDRIRVVISASFKPRPHINSVSYSQKKLSITGTGFQGNIKVSINGADVTARLKEQSATQLALSGNYKKLNLEKAKTNRLIVTVDGVASNEFLFSLP